MGVHRCLEKTNRQLLMPVLHAKYINKEPQLRLEPEYAVVAVREDLYTSHQQQHHQNQHDQSNATTRAVPPRTTVAPGGQSANKDQDEHDKQDEGD